MSTLTETTPAAEAPAPLLVRVYEVVLGF